MHDNHPPCPCGKELADECMCPRGNPFGGFRLTVSTHRLRFDYDADRPSWECDCGRSGSVGEWGDLEIAAERHVGAGDSIIYQRGGVS